MNAKSCGRFEAFPSEAGSRCATAEIASAYFGGHIRPGNLAANRNGRPLAEHESGTRQIPVAMRERGRRTLTQLFPSEENTAASIHSRIAKITTVHADESAARNPLYAGFTMRRINHIVGYSTDGACNAAESYGSRLRRGALGHHDSVAGPYLVRYA